MLTHQNHSEGSPEHRAVKFAIAIAAVSLSIGALSVVAMTDQPDTSSAALIAIRSKAYAQPKPMGSAFTQQRSETQTAQIAPKSSVQ